MTFLRNKKKYTLISIQVDCEGVFIEYILCIDIFPSDDVHNNLDHEEDDLHPADEGEPCEEAHGECESDFM
mgnify:CR=1 FL=1